jgi:hypothetical protein
MDLQELTGADEVISWFGYMQSFHDAEIVEVSLKRNSTSVLVVHCWHTSNELDEAGCFKRQKDALVSFMFTGVTDLNLDGFNQQNVIFGIELERTADELRLEILPCFGMSGTITAKEISMSVAPGEPR